MEKGHIRILAELNTQGTGKMTSSMEKALKRGLKGPATREAMSLAKRKVSAFTNGQMGPRSKDNGWTTKYMGLGSTYGMMDVSTTDSGGKTTCTDSAYTFIKTVCDTMVSMKMTKKRASVSTTGPTVASTRVGGTRESNTVLGRILIVQKTA